LGEVTAADSSLNRTTLQTAKANLLGQKDPTWISITTNVGGFSLISNVSGCQPYEALGSTQAIRDGSQMYTSYTCAEVGDKFVQTQVVRTSVQSYQYTDSWVSLSAFNVSCLKDQVLPQGQRVPETGFIGGYWLEAGSVMENGYIQATTVQQHTNVNISFPQPQPGGGMYLRFLYTCTWPADDSRYMVNDTQCTKMSTPKLWPSSQNIAELVNHPMDCPGDSLLSAFKVQKDPLHVWINYSCCKAVPRDRCGVVGYILRWWQ
jgi:hypothetical protein